ncbi:hypothetical protein B0F90DRAFT_1815193 [Multifurca ochricompacta]|uniref:Transmembrane protein n=1 Tax=Multifurca ochricompacta TaxID=376703 RepID=A0AAD4QPG3_9AGAM|nr:hypothetical protein B0F90DRAFT_1815193 [Multifurca ochricompacta]
MSSARYQPLPSDDYDEERSPTHRRYTSEHHQLSLDPRFNPPTPSWWKRALLIVFILVMFWLSFSLRASMRKTSQPQVVHAHRYSKVHKYRPAASPVIFETLKDGRHA